MKSLKRRSDVYIAKSDYGHWVYNYSGDFLRDTVEIVKDLRLFINHHYEQGFNIIFVHPEW